MRFRQSPTPCDITFKEFTLFLRHNGFQLTMHNTHNYLFEYRYRGIIRRVSCAFPHHSSAVVRPGYVREALKAVSDVRQELDRIESLEREEKYDD